MRTVHLTPVFFENFFESNCDDQFNPFITKNSRSFGKDLKLRASLFAAFLWLIAFVLSYLPQYLPLSNSLLILVYFLAGTPSLVRTIELLSQLRINISALMTLSAFLSFLIGSKLEGGLLLVLFSTSGSLEHAVLAKAKNSLFQLNKASPNQAMVLNAQGVPFEKSVKDIPVGSHVLVQAGETIPLDGVVIEGCSTISLAQITGESRAIKKQVDDTVISGSVNYEGYLIIKTTQPYSSSTISKLISLVTQAQERRPKLQKTFNKYSERYAQTVIALSFLFSVSLPYLLNIPFLGEEGSIYRSIAFLIAASPCALILALPISYLTSISTCSRKGILLKGGVSLERLAKCDTFIFDKTGTLTKGKLKLEKTEVLYGEIDQGTALQIAASIEIGSSHPIASALIEEAKQSELQLQAVENFENLVGCGVRASTKIKGEEIEVYIGKSQEDLELIPAFSKEMLEKKIAAAKEQAYTLAILHSKKHLALFWLKDELRPQIKKLLENLHNQGLSTRILTGDHHNNAEKLAKELGFSSFNAELSPEDKLKFIEQISQTNTVAMVGDGINDAPALARAHCAISMGKIGSQRAIDASHIVLMHEELYMLNWLIGFAKKTSSIIKQNLILSTVAIVATALSALFGIVPLWLAVICHEGSTLLVGLNGLRLLKK